MIAASMDALARTTRGWRRGLDGHTSRDTFVDVVEDVTRIDGAMRPTSASRRRRASRTWLRS